MLTVSLPTLFAVLVVAYFAFVYLPGRRYDQKIARAGAGRHLYGSVEHARFVLATADPGFGRFELTSAPEPEPKLTLRHSWQTDETGVFEHSFTWADRDVT